MFIFEKLRLRGRQKPQKPEKPVPGCHNCPSACCRADIVMELTDAEAEFLREAGTELYKRPRQKNAKPSEFGDWQLFTDCGYLEKDASGKTFCSIHEDPRRPSICSFFEEAGYGCLAIRRRSKVDKDEQ